MQHRGCVASLVFVMWRSQIAKFLLTLLTVAVLCCVLLFVRPEEIARRIKEHVEVRQSRDNMVFQIEELQQRVSDHRRQLDDMKAQAK